jgi:predicted RNA-binding Zn ribbon-like protein
MVWATTIDGLLLPEQLAGDPALELVNTRAGWDQPYDEAAQEYLRSYDHLAVLARSCGLLDEGVTSALRRRARRDPGPAAAEVARARAARNDLRAVLLGDASRAAATRTAEAIRSARARQQLDLTAVPGRWEFPGRPTLGDPVDAFLVAAGHLLVTGPRVDACPGHDCGWLFLNPTGRRRWCQMAVCGNRSKQAAHARRARSGPR